MNIRAKYLPSILNKNLLVIQGKYALGIIKFTKIFPIKTSEFKRLYRYHHVSDAERRAWWPHKIDQFYAYKGESVEIFKTPKKIQYPNGPRILIKPENIKFVK
jgi:hypothetical protein